MEVFQGVLGLLRPSQAQSMNTTSELERAQLQESARQQRLLIMLSVVVLICAFALTALIIS